MVFVVYDTLLFTVFTIIHIKCLSVPCPRLEDFLVGAECSSHLSLVSD